MTYEFLKKVWILWETVYISPKCIVNLNPKICFWILEFLMSSLRKWNKYSHLRFWYLSKIGSRKSLKWKTWSYFVQHRHKPKDWLLAETFSQIYSFSEYLCYRRIYNYYLSFKYMNHYLILCYFSIATTFERKMFLKFCETRLRVLKKQGTSTSKNNLKVHLPSCEN